MYSFGCPNYQATVDRLHLIAALAPDYETKKLFFNLAVKLYVEETEQWYQCFFRTLRQEMEGYYDAELTMKLAEISTHNTDLKNRFTAFAEQHPDICKADKETREGSVSYTIDKSRLSIRLLPPISEERRKKASEYAKQHGFQSGTTEP